MKVGVSLMRGAYTPEAYAYEKYLVSRKIDVQLDYHDCLYGDNDLNIYFMGMRLGRGNNRAFEIHEYQSLSTAPLARVKDHIKAYFNRRPQGRIFLNSVVREHLPFKNDAVPYIYRDMGVDAEFYQTPSCFPDFDIIYSGSIRGRPGLINILYKLALLGFKIIIVGDVDLSVVNEFSRFRGSVFFTGRVSRYELPELYRNSRCGLNFTPDIYPFNLQTSTKTLEYLASGLKVITNKYLWSESFFCGKEKHCIYLDDLDQYKCIEPEETAFGGIERYEWSKVLDSSNLYGFIEGILN